MTPEEAVIGACLLDSRVIRLAAEHVMPSDFQTWQGQEIFQTIIGMSVAGEPVDVVTVASRLAANGSRIHAAELHAVLQEVPTAANVEFYAAQVRQASVRRGLRSVGARLIQDAEDDSVEPVISLQAALQALKTVRDDAPVTGLDSKPLEDVLAAEDSYDWVIRDLLERGDRFVLTGGEGAGKSTFMRQLAIFAAAGIHPFYLRPIPPVRVTVVDRENSERQWRRKARRLTAQGQAFGSADPAKRLILSCEPRALDITRDSDLGKIHKLLDDHPTDILFIGPLYKLVPRAINSDDEAAPLIAALDSLRDRGVCLVMEAHAGHTSGGAGIRDLRPRGSAAILGWPEFGRGLRASAAEPGKFTLERWRGDRDERDFPDVLLRGSGPIPWTPEGGIPPELRMRFQQPYNQGTFMDRTANDDPDY